MKLLFISLLGVIHIHNANANCLDGDDSGLPNVLKIQETVSAGTVIVNVTSDDDDDKWSYSVTRVNNDTAWVDRFRGYFRTDKRNQTYYLVLAREIDLEAVNIMMGLLYNVTIQIECHSSVGLSLTHSTEVSILPVEEFPPFFKGTPFSITLPEDTDVGEVVFDFSTVVDDDDVLGDETRVFSVVPYIIQQFDGSSTFVFKNRSTGLLKLNRVLDYEAMVGQLGRPFYMINVTVQDAGKLTGYGRLNVTILDTDDQGPEFFHEGCPRPCLHLELSAHVTHNFTGQILKQPLLARDRDSLNNPIQYSIVEAEYSDYFFVDKTGHVMEIHPLVNESITEFNLTIMAQEISVNGFNVFADITVIVESRK